MSENLADRYRNQAAASSSAYDKASADGFEAGKAIKTPGTFLMQPACVAFYNNKKSELVTGPRLEEASTKTVMFKMSFKAIKAIGPIAAGDYTFYNFPLWAGAEADETKRENIAKYAKGVIAKLVGTKDVHPDDVDWVLKNLITEAEMDGENVKIINTPDICNRTFLVEIVEDLAPSGAIKMDVSSFREATGDDDVQIVGDISADPSGDSGDIGIPTGNTSEAGVTSERAGSSDIVEDDLPF